MELFKFEWNYTEPQPPWWFHSDANRKKPRGWVVGGDTWELCSEQTRRVDACRSLGTFCNQQQIAALSTRWSHLVLQVNQVCQKEKLNLLTVSCSPPGAAVVADLGPACCSWSALRRVCGHEAVRLSPPVPLVPPGPGSCVGAPAAPPAGGQPAHPAPDSRSVLVRPPRNRVTTPSD